MSEKERFKAKTILKQLELKKWEIIRDVSIISGVCLVIIAYILNQRGGL